MGGLHSATIVILATHEDYAIEELKERNELLLLSRRGSRNDPDLMQIFVKPFLIDYPLEGKLFFLRLQLFLRLDRVDFFSLEMIQGVAGESSTNEAESIFIVEVGGNSISLDALRSHILLAA